ncbi:MAG TPA: ribonuclease catalytic domain-containing protein, partial [Pseudonocardia sp.]|nr:ribonuclease catalytic domain-containing protein [Pseudonocardia sp.]
MALTSASGTVPDFAAVRAEFALPTGFPAAVLAEAAEAAARAATGDGRVDATDIELVTIDPPGAKDLDQALGITRRGDGFRVHYAIADLGAVVAPGGAIDAEVRKRGQTVYLPDGSVPLHPPVLSEGASSLLPDGPRAAVLWTID